jgi:integrase
MAKVAFTAGRVDGHKCPAGKPQAFLWDATAPGLGLRVTAAGAKAYIFQSEFEGKSLRMTIGSPDAWSIPQAQEKARELQRTIDQGRDPRLVKAEVTAADVAKREAEINDVVTVAEVWAAYLADRRPHWGDRHYQDHVKKAKAGGEKAKRGTRGRGVTVAGPLYPLMALKLRDLDADTVEAWAKRQASDRPTSARLAWRLLKGFLTWCSEQKPYAHLVPAKNPAKTKKSREALGKPVPKQDVLQREQLAPWFDAVSKIENPVIAAYLRVLLLTGARPGEVVQLKWSDINRKWKGITIRDKVEGERIIPLTPYIAHLLDALPKRNEWVFSGGRVEVLKPAQAKAPKKGAEPKPRPAAPISRPQWPHALACKAAGIEGLTLHGLRRSFASLTEWVEVPAGVVAQIMGHKPSATAEKHYKIRPLELLRMHHEKIEAWVLEQAGVRFSNKNINLTLVSTNA